MATITNSTHLLLVADDHGEIASLDVLQGMWTEAQYLRLTDYSRRLIELSRGSLEVLPMPTDKHQAIIGWLYILLHTYLSTIGGVVLFAALRMETGEGRFREPDLLALLDANDPRRENRFWHGADLVIEVVSPDDPERDTVVKRAEYAEAGIPEYWIVDPATETISVLTLADGQYADHGIFHRGETLTSPLLPGFTALVDAILDAR